MSRPSTDGVPRPNIVSFRVSEATYDSIQKLAKKRNLTVAAFAHKAMDRYLQQVKRG